MTTTKLIVAYPQPANVEDFERAYQEEHVPLALDKLRGLTKLVATKTIASPQGSPAFYRFQEMRKTTMMLVGLLLTGLPGFAQTISGSIAGRVVDAQGAVVPNASVTVTEPSKNLRVSSKTSAGGDFLV